MIVVPRPAFYPRRRGFSEVQSVNLGDGITVLPRRRTSLRWISPPPTSGSLSRRRQIKVGPKVLKHSRWCLLKRPENHTELQRQKLADLLRHNLRTVRAYLLKETFQHFWTYRSPGWAIAFLDRWCAQVMRSRLKPMKRVARMLQAHRLLILNWFKARGLIALGAVEGLNNASK